MKSYKILIVPLTVISIFWAGVSIAHPPSLSEAMGAYIKRDGLMHLIRAQRYLLQEMLVGKRKLDQAEFVRAARALEAMFAMIPSTFQESAMVDYSRAKPEIWEKWDDFVAKAEELRKLSADIASTGEIYGAEAALEKVRLYNCGNCHDPYRK